MNQHPFAWSLIILMVLGAFHTILEKLFWRRLRAVDPDAGPRLLGVDLTQRRSAGLPRLWRFLFKREYAQIPDRRVVRLGDGTLISLIAFGVIFLALFGALIFRALTASLTTP